MKSSPSGPIRVMLVDDQTMIRRGLATFLKVLMICNWWAKPKAAKQPSKSVRKPNRM